MGYYIKENDRVKEIKSEDTTYYQELGYEILVDNSISNVKSRFKADESEIKKIEMRLCEKLPK